MPSVSDAVAAVAAAMPQPPRRRQIAFTDIDFPAVGQIWLAQDRFKDHLIIIQSEDGMIDLEQYEKDVTDQTLLTCVPHAGYRNGFKQDIKQIAEIVHQKGSLLFVDAYQTAGHIPIHVKDMDIDILAAGTRKYMLGIDRRSLSLGSIVLPAASVRRDRHDCRALYFKKCHRTDIA